MATNIGYLRSKTKTTEHPVIIVKYFNFNLESRVVRQLVPMNFCSCSSIEMEHISEGWTDCVSQQSTNAKLSRVTTNREQYLQNDDHHTGIAGSQKKSSNDDSDIACIKDYV